MALLALLAGACGPGGSERDLDVIGSPGGSDGGGSGTEVWSPGVDTGEDSLEDAWAAQASFDCGALDAESPSSGEGVLETSWCGRLSPEGDELDQLGGSSGEDDTGGSCGGPLLPAASGTPPPCGFYNLVGAVDFELVETEAGTGVEVLYCDSDLGGGMRLARLAPGSEELQTVLVSEHDCLADVDTGLLLPHPQGSRLVWSNLDGIRTAVVDPRGELVEEPRTLAGLDSPWRLRLRPGSAAEDGSAAVVYVQDTSDTLWQAELDLEAGTATPTPLLTGMATLAAAAVGSEGDTLLATCAGVDEPLHLSRVGPTGTLAWSGEVPDARCGWDARLSLAVHAEGGTAAVAWDDGDQSHVVFLDTTLDPGADGLSVEDELSRSTLSESGRHPQVTWDGSRFVLLDGNGRGHLFDAEGEAGEIWTQPMLADRSGNLWGQRLQADAERWTVVQLAQDTLVTDIGHLYTFYYVEATASPAP